MWKSNFSREKIDFSLEIKKNRSFFGNKKIPFFFRNRKIDFTSEFFCWKKSNFYCAKMDFLLFFWSVSCIFCPIKWDSDEEPSRSLDKSTLLNGIISVTLILTRLKRFAWKIWPLTLYNFRHRLAPRRYMLPINFVWCECVYVQRENSKQTFHYSTNNVHYEFIYHRLIICINSTLLHSLLGWYNVFV